MHTSKMLTSADFQFWQVERDKLVRTDFNAFCADYHMLDRVGVVSPRLEDGIFNTGYALLALTTAFYDLQRARSADFFAYPQHFAFVGVNGAGLQTGGGSLPLETDRLWDAWSWLDVWPDSKWVTAPATASGMLQHVFGFQINRLFWPYDLKPGQAEERLPAYVFKMLRTSLKAVYYYHPTAAGQESPGGEIGLRGTQVVEEIVQDSIAKLPNAASLWPGSRRSLERSQPAEAQAPYTEWYQPVSLDDFLAAMHHFGG